MSAATGIEASSILTFSGGISNNGTILASQAGIRVFAVNAFAGGINNSGKIRSPSNGGIGLSNIGVFGTTNPGGGISNSGTISAIVGIGQFNVTTFVGGISNRGFINAGMEGIFLEQGSRFSGGIANSGTLSAAGTLTVSDGRHAASIVLFGNYMAGSFVTAADGHGGTLVAEAPPTAQSPLLTRPHG